MPADWSVYLLNHNGLRLDDLSKNQGFEFARVANNVGSFRVTMGPGFDDSLLAKNYRVEIWRNFLGGSVLLFSGLIDRWLTEDDQTHIEGKCINALLDQRVILPASGEMGPTRIFSGTVTNDTFQISTDTGATWSSMGTPGVTTGGITDSILAADGSLIVTISDTHAAGAQKGRIYRSTDAGRTYVLVHTNSNAGEITTDGLVRVPTTDTLIAVTGSSGTNGSFIRSTDNGVNWTETDTTGGTSTLLRATAAGNGYIVAGGRDGFFADPTIWISTDDGQNFSSAQVLTTPSDYQIASMYTLRNGDILCGLGPSQAEVWRSRDNGLSWSLVARLHNVDGNCDYCTAFTQLPSGIVLAGGRQGAPVFGSSDNGESWWLIDYLTAAAESVYSFLLLNNGEVLASTNDSGRVYQSSNNGRSWALLSTTGETTTDALSWVFL